LITIRFVGSSIRSHAWSTLDSGSVMSSATLSSAISLTVVGSSRGNIVERMAGGSNRKGD
jgi:hypothetical protein